MKTITLVIKGTVEEAKIAAQSRGFVPRATRHMPSWGETIVTIDGYGPFATLAEWLSERNQVPYPSGTLLYYRYE